MQDLVIKGTGNSRLLKSVSNFMSLYPTYEDFVQALVAGTLPIDLNGFNSAGVQTQGTPLNKTNLLKDATANKYGLGGNATIDDVLSQIPTGSFPNMTAGKATTATNATNTDFTNAEWTTKLIGETATFDIGGTYEIQVNDGEQDKWFPFPLVTVASQDRHIALAFVDDPAHYIKFTCAYGAASITLNSTWQYSSQWRYRKIR